MISTEYAQLAKELGMKLEQGVGYGLLQGYPVTFLDGIGCHRLMITTRFSAPKQKDELLEEIDRQPLSSYFHVKKLQIAKKVIYVVFRNDEGSVEKIKEFVEWLLPLLPQDGASPATTCIQCGEQIQEEDLQWVLRDGSVAFVMHKGCADKLREDLHIDKDRVQTVVKGLGGAALGALLGALAWMALTAIGWMANVAGLVIGWLCVNFYHRFGGKDSKLKIPIMVLMGAVGVALGIFLGEIPAMVQNGAGWNVIAQFIENLTTNEAFWEGILDALSMGLMMMLIGLFIAYRGHSRKSQVTVTDLGATEEEA